MTVRQLPPVLRLVALVAPLTLAIACGGGKDSPTSPSTQTPPAAFTLTMTSDWPASRVDSPTVTGNGNALGVAWPGPNFSATDGRDAGAIWVAVKATGANVGQVRGTLKWDRALLSFDGYSQGPWFAQNGALVTWTLLTNTPGEVGFLLDRPSTLDGATGTGTVIYLRLRALARGTSALQWDDPALRGTNGSARPLTGGSFGGTITIN